jgi:hypothetical protein
MTRLEARRKAGGLLILSLPMHAYMSEDDAARVAEVVLKNL